MNWKIILIGGILLALAGLLIAFTGGINFNPTVMAAATPLLIFLIFVILMANTYYQTKILDELREIRRRLDDDQEE